MRGGNWNNTSNAGVFMLNLNNPRTNTNSNIGFRSAVLLVRNFKPKGLVGSTKENGHVPPVTTEKLNF